MILISNFSERSHVKNHFDLCECKDNVNSIVKMKVCLTENVGNSQKDRVGDISLHLHHTAKHTEMGTKSDQITK